MSSPTRIGAREDHGDEAIQIDTGAGSMYLVIVPSRDPINKRGFMEPSIGIIPRQ
jgi:hypothetical protein